jgi:hypothetical protein
MYIHVITVYVAWYIYIYIYIETYIYNFKLYVTKWFMIHIIYVIIHIYVIIYDVYIWYVYIYIRCWRHRWARWPPSRPASRAPSAICGAGTAPASIRPDEFGQSFTMCLTCCPRWIWPVVPDECDQLSSIWPVVLHKLDHLSPINFISCPDKFD